MKFRETPLQGAYLIEPEKRGDERGFFARLFCEKEFAAQGLVDRFVQINNSVSSHKGTLRGLHYQLTPATEAKVVRCIRGSFYDVIIDLRPDSRTYGKSFGVELTAESRLTMYVPRGCAHGMLTLKDDTEAIYLVSEFYSPENERGLRWNDPHFKVKWPITPQDVSEKDRKWPNFNTDFHGVERLHNLL